jgi:hypothetical protein
MFLKKDLLMPGKLLDSKEEIGMSVILLSMEDSLLLGMYISSEKKRKYSKKQ